MLKRSRLPLEKSQRGMETQGNKSANANVSFYQWSSTQIYPWEISQHQLHEAHWALPWLIWELAGSILQKVPLSLWLCSPGHDEVAGRDDLMMICNVFISRPISYQLGHRETLRSTARSLLSQVGFVPSMHVLHIHSSLPTWIQTVSLISG